MKNVIVHSLTFCPDGVSTAYLYGDIALALKQSGYKIKVITSTPHYNKPVYSEQKLKWKLWGIVKESYFNGIQVLHIPQNKSKYTIVRLINFIYWHFFSFLICLFTKKIDLIISPSPPLTLGLVNAIIGKIKNCKVVYNVQEIYPDILNLNEGVILKLLQKVERYVYAYSDRVIAIDKVFFDTLKNRIANDSKLEIIPNFVDTSLYKPDISTNQLDQQFFPTNNNIKLLYAGNIGHAQNWDLLLSLAKMVESLDIDFFVIGEGVKKKYLENEVQNRSLKNIHILPYQERSLMPSIIAYSDIQFIFMNHSGDKNGFPSKIYTIMACAKPLLISTQKDTPIYNFFKDINCSLLFTDNNEKNLIDNICLSLKNIKKEELKTLGNNGLKIVLNNYSKDIVTMKYVNLVNELLS